MVIFPDRPCETCSFPLKSLTHPSVIWIFIPTLYFAMSSPQSVNVVVPVESWRVASATEDVPREVVTSRGAEIAVIDAEKVAFWLARMLAMSPMVDSGIDEELNQFARLCVPWVVVTRDVRRTKRTLSTR